MVSESGTAARPPAHQAAPNVDRNNRSFCSASGDVHGQPPDCAITAEALSDDVLRMAKPTEPVDSGITEPSDADGDGFQFREM